MFYFLAINCRLSSLLRKHNFVKFYPSSNCLRGSHNNKSLKYQQTVLVNLGKKKNLVFRATVLKTLGRVGSFF